MKKWPTAPLISVLMTTAWAGSRVANTTIDLPGQPPSTAVEVVNAFPGLSFASPLCLRSPRGDDRRLFVCEKGGDLELIPDVTAASPVKTLFLDLDQIVASRGETLLTGSEQGLLSVAFHPNYDENGLFFTVYNVRSGGINYQRLSRWHDPDQSDTVADPDSEAIFIEMRNDAGNHNGGDLHFGPDGYLYMSWGDEGSANDFLNNSQYLDKDFWSSVTRIDVDLETEDDPDGDDANLRPNAHPAVKLSNGDPLYEIPADNPWVGADSFNGVPVDPSKTRTEFFAVGLRNPWRMSFDGDELWIGDVGQGAREEITIAPLGSNHGWAWYEGDLNGPKFGNPINGATQQAINPTLPVWDYRRGSGEYEGRSVTGGLVYRGKRVPELTGHYVFADYVSGNIWALKRTAAAGEPEVRRIAGEGGIVGFGTDPSNGDLLMADLNSNVIQRLVARDLDSRFPDTLAETGIFSDLVNLTPNPGVVPYDVNLPFWSDHALKQRWFAIKNTSDLIHYAETGSWSFPNGMIWVKHFDLELERGNPATPKRIETRVLVRNQTGETTSVSLLEQGAPSRYLIPSDPSVEETWMTVDFDDSAWSQARTGIGYDENSTYLSEFGAGGNLGAALNGENTSLYLRLPFQVGDPTTISSLTLRLKYDDGFQAYLNGQPVASANAPGTVTWQANATANHPDGSALSYEDFPIPPSLLVEGENLLAIQGLNDGLGSSDMLISPALTAERLTDVTEGIYGVSYRWNEAGTGATLVPSAGESIDFSVTTSTGIRTQTWNIPSRASCLTCHTPQAGLALSFNTLQLNHPGEIEGSSGNFLNLLFDSGYLDQAPGNPAVLPRHLAADEDTYSLEARVRSYLDVNCAYCHREGGSEPESWLGNYERTMHQTGLINGMASGGTGHPDDRLVVPGNPTRSIVLSRVAARNGYSRMPPLATNEDDEAAIQLLTDWINQEATAETGYPAWRLARFGNTTSAAGEPGSDPDHDGFSNHKEYLALTDPGNRRSFPTLDLQATDTGVEFTVPALSNRSILIESSTNLENWAPWPAPENDGLPRNPALGPVRWEAPTTEGQMFLRLRIEER